MMQVQKGSSTVNWISKSKSHRTASSDVSINIIKGAKDSKCPKAVSLIFRDKIWTRFKSRFVLVGIAGEKMCFMGTDDSSEGFTLSDATGNYNRYVKLTNPTVVAWAKSRVGDYELKSNGEYFFIDTERS